MKIDSATLRNHLQNAPAVYDIKIGEDGVLYSIDSLNNLLYRGSYLETIGWLHRKRYDNIAFWLRASDSDSLTLEDDDGTDVVASWACRNNSDIAFDATSTQRPTYTSEGINSKPSVTFDGTNTYLQEAGAVLTGQSGAVIAVVDRVSGTGNSGIYAQADVAANNNYLECYSVDASTKIVVRAKNGSADTNDLCEGPSTGIGSDARVLAFYSDGAAWGLRQNGVAQTLTATAGANNGDWGGDVDDVDWSFIGALKRNTIGPSCFYGDIAEMIALSQFRSIAEVATVEAYLMAEYGIS